MAEYGPHWVLTALEHTLAVKQQGRKITSFRYITAMLEKWDKEGGISPTQKPRMPGQVKELNKFSAEFYKQHYRRLLENPDAPLYPDGVGDCVDPWFQDEAAKREKDRREAEKVDPVRAETEDRAKQARLEWEQKEADRLRREKEAADEREAKEKADRAEMLKRYEANPDAFSDDELRTVTQALIDIGEKVGPRMTEVMTRRRELQKAK